MTRTNGVRVSVHPLSRTATTSSAATPRPGYDTWGRALKDRDVWGGIKTPDGKVVNTGDGIDEAEAAVLNELAETDTVQFLHRLGADSKNGTPITYRREDVIAPGATVTSAFTARDGKVVVEVAVEVSQELAQRYLRNYIASPEKQVTAPLIAKVTLTGAINRQGEIADLKAQASLSNLPRLSTAKLGDFERYTRIVLRSLPVGETITEPMRELVADYLDIMLRASSLRAVELAHGLVVEDPPFKIEISREGRAGAAHIKAGKNGLDVQLDHVLDVVGANTPRIDVKLDSRLDAADDDTLNVGTVTARTTERLVASFADHRTQLYRVERDGSRTKLDDRFARLVVGSAFLRAARA